MISRRNVINRDSVATKRANRHEEARKPPASSARQAAKKNENHAKTSDIAAGNGKWARLLQKRGDKQRVSKNKTGRNASEANERNKAAADSPV